MTDTVGVERPAVEVADVIREHGEAFLAKHGGGLTDVQRRALRDLAPVARRLWAGTSSAAATAATNGIAYNSCRNRHCPKCQAAGPARWLEREATFLLPV